MTFHPALPPLARPLRPPVIGFSCRTRLTGRDSAGFILSGHAQREFFGTDLAGWGAGVMIGSGDEAGQAVLTVWPEPGRQALPVTPLVKGTVIIRFWAEPRFLPGKVASGDCRVISRTDHTLVVALPEPALPSAGEAMNLNAPPNTDFNRYEGLPHDHHPS